MVTEGFQGAKVLVTGGLGFIGSNLVRRLVDLGAVVTVVDSLVAEYGGNLYNIAGLEDRIRINISDVRDEHSLKYLVRNQQYLFNLAGQTSHMDSMADPFTDLEINCRAQLSILETCRRHNPDVQLVFASTRQMYGAPNYLPVDERHLLQPVDVNGINKMAGEWYHILYNNVYGIRSCSLRLTNTYGPRMRIKDARQTFLGVWILRVLQNEPFEVWGGDQMRDFTYVDDAVAAMLMTAQSDAAKGQVFNLGGERPVSLRETADLLIAAHGSGEYKVMEFPANRKSIDIGDFYADFSSITEAIGWTPRVALPEGLRQTLAYYKDCLSEYL